MSPFKQPTLYLRSEDSDETEGEGGRPNWLIVPQIDVKHRRRYRSLLSFFLTNLAFWGYCSANNGEDGRGGEAALDVWLDGMNTEQACNLM